MCHVIIMNVLQKAGPRLNSATRKKWHNGLQIHIKPPKALKFDLRNHFHRTLFDDAKNDRKPLCKMENSEADDFEGLIDFLVQELAINDWNKGNAPTASRVRSSALLEGKVQLLSQAFMRDGIDMYLYGIPLAEYTLADFWVMHKSCGYLV